MRFSLLLLLCLAAPAFADVVTLNTGDRLVGKIVDENDEAVFLQHPMFGTLKIARNTIVTDAEPRSASPQVAAPAPEKPAPPPEPKRSALMQKLNDINLKLEAGFNGKDGNSESLSARVGLKANQETDDHRWNADAAYNRASNNGIVNRNEVTAGATKDWLLNDSPWFYYVRGRYDWDQFEAWDHRLSLGAGVGYEFIDNDTVQLLGRAGIGGVREWGSEDTDIHPEAEAGGELKWKITEAQTLEATHMVFKALDDDPFRMRTTVQWVMKLNHADGVSVKLGLVNEHDSEPGDDKKRNDLSYYGALVFDF